MSTPKGKGFTLIELLIVVAIIAILAAIAVPNFLEAQTRSKVARAKADIRSIATALEAYAVDSNHYPFDITTVDGMSPPPTAGYWWYVPYRITTPVAYISSGKILDTFREKRGTPALTDVYRRFRYVNYQAGPFNAQFIPRPELLPTYAEGQLSYGKWRLSSSGPDASAGPGSPVNLWVNDINNWGNPHFPRVLVVYDPSNGTVSHGDIVRSQAQSDQKQDPYVM